jgi:transposase
MRPYSQDLRERIVTAVKAEQNKQSVAEIFKVSLSSVKRYCKLEAETGSLAPRKNPGRPTKIKPDQYEALGQQLKTASDQTQDYHCQLWFENHQVSLSPSTLSRLLDRMGWSRKKKSLCATERDEDKRTAFRAKQAGLDVNKLVVVDETSTNLALTSLYGYAPVGERVYDSVPRNHGANVTMIAALTAQGMSNETAIVFEGGTDARTFELYIRQFLCPTLLPGQIVILDNLAAHDSEGVRAAIQERGCELLFLPPYSPDLTPTLIAFSKIKQFLRQVAARTRKALEDALDKALALIKPEEALAFFRHCGYSLAGQSFCNPL